MTRYDEPPASDGKGGPHPLAGVPQHILDAARNFMDDAADCGDIDPDMAHPLADAVVQSVVRLIQVAERERCVAIVHRELSPQSLGLDCWLAPIVQTRQRIKNSIEGGEQL